MQEIYSIRLPGDPKLGEGKPENQNHAIVFTRGNALQTIDMNQVSMHLIIRPSFELFCVFVIVKVHLKFTLVN